MPTVQMDGIMSKMSSTVEKNTTATLMQNKFTVLEMAQLHYQVYRKASCCSHAGDKWMSDKGKCIYGRGRNRQMHPSMRVTQLSISGQVIMHDWFWRRFPWV